MLSKKRNFRCYPTTCFTSTIASHTAIAVICTIYLHKNIYIFVDFPIWQQLLITRTTWGTDIGIVVTCGKLVTAWHHPWLSTFILDGQVRQTEIEVWTNVGNASSLRQISRFLKEIVKKNTREGRNLVSSNLFKELLKVNQLKRYFLKINAEAKDIKSAS